MAANRMMLVPIRAFEEDRLAIDEELAGANFDLAKADLERNRLESVAVLVTEGNRQIVLLRSLRRPLMRMRDLGIQIHRARGSDGCRLRQVGRDSVAVRVCKFCREHDLFLLAGKIL